MSFIQSRIRLAAAAVALGVLAASCGSADTVADVDGGETLTVEEVTDLVDERFGVAAQVGDTELTGEQLSQLTDGVLDKTQAAQVITSWVRNELFYTELADRGYEVDDSFFAEARERLEAFAAQDPTVPDPDSADGAIAIRGLALGPIVFDYLDGEGVEPEWPGELCSSHILLDTEEEAVAAVARLDEGEGFAELAMELSIGPSGPDGGDLGCADSGGFVPEFSAAAIAVDAPGVSAPVESQFGWHVIDVRSFTPQPSEDPAAIQAAVIESSASVAFQDAALAREVILDPTYGEWDAETATVVTTES